MRSSRRLVIAWEPPRLYSWESATSCLPKILAAIPH